VVIEAARAWLADVSADVAVIEAVKLVESGLHQELDEVWLVVCSRDECRRRLALRGWAPEHIERRLAASAPLGPRLAAAAVVIDNSGERNATERQLEIAWQKVKRQALRSPSSGDR
jgi:dephospho-CoA kinase